MAFPVSLAQAQTMTEECLKNRLVPMIVGSPGCGKSAMLQAIADKYNLKLLDLRLGQCDPTDLNGFPNIDPETKRGYYSPMEFFPLEGDTIPEGYEGWLLAMDELNAADNDIQKAAYKTLYDMKVGDRPIHSKCAIAAAGNLMSDNAIVEKMSTALQSRMIHIEVKLDNDEWLEWASMNGIDHRIRSFIRFKPNLLFDFNPDHDDKTFACPRTWSFASKLIQNKNTLEYTDKALLAGTLSEGVGREFAQFCSIYQQLPTLSSIVSDPLNAQVPQEPSTQFAVSGMIGANLNTTNAKSLMQYVTKLPIEFQIITLRDAYRQNSSVVQVPEVSQTLRQYAQDLF